MDFSFIPQVESIIGYSFQDKSLLSCAFIHCSFYHEHRDQLESHNERLEFLGDTVLGLFIAEHLYLSFSLYTEGELSRLRSHLVGASCCAKFSAKLGIDAFVLLGKGEKLNQGKGRESILADLFEALLAAIYLDGGVEEAKKFFWSHFKEEVDKITASPIENWKAELQEYSQKKYQKAPLYKVFLEEGPDHKKDFSVAVYLNEREMGKGVGASKKSAEQAAAYDALIHLSSGEKDK